MSEQSPARVLLLEQLESRQLLAGGFMAHSTMHTDEYGGQHRPEPFNGPSRDARPGDVRLLANPRPRVEAISNFSLAGPRSELHPPTVHNIRPVQNIRNVPLPPPPSVSVVVPIESSATALPISAINATSVLRASEIQAVIKVPVPSGGTITFLIPSVEAGQRIAATSNAATSNVAVGGATSAKSSAPPTRTVSAQPAMTGNATSGNIDRGTTGADADVQTTGKADSADSTAPNSRTVPGFLNVDSQPGESDQSMTGLSNVEVEQGATFGDSSSNNHSEYDSGFDASPFAYVASAVLQSLGQSKSRQLETFESFEPKDDSDDAWQIDRVTLDRLRDLSRQGSDVPLHVSGLDHDHASYDHAIADWFSGPGGMIEIQRAGNVLMIPDSESMIVEIPLDAIFGSYRWFELAASDQSTGDDIAIRDAVLAAIGGVQGDEVAPLHEPAATRADSLVYSGTALIAGTLAFARRRKSVNMLATSNADNDLEN
ncbi:MAG: hypothetical protein KDB00_28465 [Planctomycetales bacterium]|nr:hypothetical protein [Planctomycetales bacterium]